MTSRCSNCAINFPYTPFATGCRVCKGKLDPFQGMNPDDDWKERSDAMIEERDAPEEHYDDPVKRWRFAQAILAGATPSEAQVVSENRGIDLEQFRALATRPECGPSLAFEILS